MPGCAIKHCRSSPDHTAGRTVAAMKRLLALVLPVALAGCVAATNAATLALAGSEWRLLAIDGDAAASAGNHLKFDRGQLSASVGCNRIGGNYRVERERLIAGPLIQTEMYCEGPLMGQEQALSALLVGAPELRLGGNRLTLVSRGHRAEFARLPG
jgi:heat shock protein HslJ